jgi:hypothetical protein
MRIVLFDHPVSENANLGNLKLQTSIVAKNRITWYGLYYPYPGEYITLTPLGSNLKLGIYLFSLSNQLKIYKNA